MTEQVQHPKHYQNNILNIEPYLLTGRINSCIGQALQYVIRRKLKNNEKEDLEKAIFWLKAYQSFYHKNMADTYCSSICIDYDKHRVTVIIEGMCLYAADPFVREFFCTLFTEAGLSIIQGECLKNAIKYLEDYCASL